MVHKYIWLMLYLIIYTSPLHAMDEQVKPLQACASCHAKQTTEWRSSHHFHAMEEASHTSVLANFDNQSLSYQQTDVSFYIKENNYFISMPNPTGKLTEYQVTHTFGYQPLQQYMFDFGDGRLQFFPFAWDSRTKEQGGQRWFVLHPEQSKSDVFHWTQMGQNWNHMCADCHSTDFKKNFDLTTNQFNSSYSAINVSCNACHGDSQQHLAWANGNNDIADKGYSHYIGAKTPLFVQQATGEMTSVTELKQSEQIPVCATCHARRSNLADRKDPHDLFNAFQPALLTDELYHVDGQVWDENYVWGSFKQSKMYQAGVTCTNCHNPHTGKLKLPDNETCTQCHAPTTFETPQHHGHKLGLSGSQCVDCHMPATTYMQVDARRDHSFSVPRPDLTLATNVPNACNSCHNDQTAQWAVNAIKTWHPEPKHIGKPHFATSFFAADHALPGADTMLTQISQDQNFPSIVRASALARMANTPGNNAIVAIARAVKQDEPLQRLAAITAAQSYNINDRWRMLSPLLTDSHKSVRIEAANSLASMLVQPFPNPLSDQDKLQLSKSLEEYKNAQKYQSERGYSHVNLGNLALQLNDQKTALNHFKTAIQIEPIFMPAYINLADLYRQQNNEVKSKDVLNQALEVNANAAEVHYALAMSFIRSQQKNKALNSLSKATKNAPNNANYYYTFGLLLENQNQRKAAIYEFEKAFKLNPNNPDISYSLAQAYAAENQFTRAVFYAENLNKLVPNNRQIQDLVKQLRMMQSIY